MSVIEDLKAAKAEIEKRGWCKGDLVNHQGCVCLLGGVGMATVEDFGELEYESDRYRALDAGGRASAALAILRPHIVALLGRNDVEMDDDSPIDIGWQFNDRQLSAGAVLNLIDQTVAALEAE